MKAVRPFTLLLSFCLPLYFTAGCSREESTPEPVVTVKAAQVKRAPISRVITAEAVLYPLQQSVIVPKISAPVKKFYVNRGAKVRQGQLLAVLDQPLTAGSFSLCLGNAEAFLGVSIDL